MELKPVKQSRNPGYPTLRSYVENPALLSKNIPLSWIKNKYVAASLAAFILCSSPKDTNNIKAKPAVVFDDSVKNKVHEKIKKEKKETLKIAPIFSHGEGAGATGCVVSSPPVFISEAEARTIIFDALKKENIDFDTTNCQTFEFKAEPIANDDYNEDNYSITDSNKANVILKMDGFNEKYNLAIQYVSEDDFYKFKNTDLILSSVQGYNTKKAAKIIREKFLIDSKTNAVIFYDPLKIVEYVKNLDWKKSRDNAKGEAKKLLLAQVEDFIKWIKAEGILNK